MRRRVRDIHVTPQAMPQQGQPLPRRVRFWPRLLLALVPALVVLGLFVIWPVSHAPLPLEAGRQSGQKAEQVAHPSLLPLLVEEAFLKNRLTMAKTDSVALTIDLVDSVMTLDIKGVPVWKSKIERYELSGALHRARRSPRLKHWLAKPFVLQNEYGTIAKAPIKKVDAPKDTIEAEKLANMMPPPDSGDVAFVLDFSRNLTVKVCQSEKLSGEGRMQKTAVEVHQRLARLGHDLAALRRLQMPSAPLVVSLRVPRADAKAVYRALPRRALLAFRF